MDRNSGDPATSVGFFQGSGATIGTNGAATPFFAHTTDLKAQTAIVPITTGATDWGITVSSTTGSVGHVCLTVEVFGNTAQPGTSICCVSPTDSNNNAVLQQLLQLVTLIQRNKAPFASVHGTTHSGLTGSGNFTVQGILGLAVSLTAVPTSVGLELGNPDVLFDVGWLNVGTADGWVDRKRVSADPFLWAPDLMSMMTRVGFTLMPGVVATITEIKPEP